MLKGSSFCPSTKGTYLDAKAELAVFTRKLKIREKYFNSNFTNDALVKDKNTNPVICKNNELNRICRQIEDIAPTKIDSEPNLSPEESQALKTLRSYDDIVIKKADKGGMFVILDTDFYRDKMVLQDHLDTDTYEIVNENADMKVVKALKELTTKYSKCLRESERKYINNKDWKSSNIYISPKVHKCKEIIKQTKTCNSEYIHMPCPPDLKGRPIIAGPAAPTQRLSELIEKILSPLVPLLKSYVKDDWNFVNKLPRTTDFDCEIYSIDIVSLYTNIPHSLGLEAVSYYVDKFRSHIPQRFSKEFIMDSVKFVLSNNNFFFDGICRHQKEGTAMGSKMAVPYACLSIGYLEETKLHPLLHRHFPLYVAELIIRWFLRYIDDGYILWPRGWPIDRFLEIINSLDPHIQFTLEASKKYIKNNQHFQELSFLDVLTILINYRVFTTDIFYKETNSHFYLDYHSHHPSHMKDNIPYSLAKKLICFVPDYNRLEFRLAQLKTWLIKRNYPPHLIDKKFHNAKLEGPAPPPIEDTKDTLIFSSTYTNNYSHKNTVNQINSLFHLPRTIRIQEVFGNCKLMQAYRQPKNLLRHLTKASFTSTTALTNAASLQASNITEPGLFKCKHKGCKLCKLYIQECKRFTTHNGFEWEIRSHITCNSKNVLYYLKCMKCKIWIKQEKYTGKTKVLRDRMNNHISDCRLGGSSDLFDQHVFECKKQHPEPEKEPYFHIYAFMTVKKEESLLTYEKHLHRQGYDSMNGPS